MSLQTDKEKDEQVKLREEKGEMLFGAVSQCLLKRKRGDLSCGKLD